MSNLDIEISHILRLNHSIPSPAIILIVDGDDYQRHILRVHLERRGYTVEEAEEGEKALALLETMRPSLILMDAEMPVMNGFETCRKIRRNAQMTDLPILMITSVDDPKMVNEAFAAGVDEYVAKPINFTVLMNRIVLVVQSSIYRKQREEKIAAQSAELCITKQMAEGPEQVKVGFLENMNHELKTPLHAILNLSSMGIKKSVTESSLEVLFFRISENGKRLKVLIDNLLDLSQLGVGQMAYQWEEVHLKSILTMVMRDRTEKTQKKKVFFNIRAPPQIPMLLGDKKCLLLVFSHVFDNAIRFSPDGSCIEVSLEVHKKVICLEIRDQGPGISGEEQEKMFAPFMQSSRTRLKAGGAGLGLAICRKVIEAHKGYITVSNHPECGTVVRINFSIE